MLWASALAAIFFVAHLAFLPPTLEDLDSMNFALGVRDFDPSKHQPHPPGYPIFIALGKLSHAVWPSDAGSLSLWGAIFGALAVFPLIALFRSIEAMDQHRERCDARSPCGACDARGRGVAAVLVYRAAAAQRHAGARHGARRAGVPCVGVRAAPIAGPCGPGGDRGVRPADRRRRADRGAGRRHAHADDVADPADAVARCCSIVQDAAARARCSAAR